MRREKILGIFDMYTLLFVIVILSGVFLMPKNILANIIINEINWNGTETSSSDEWIELYNNSTEEIDLNNWTINWNDNTIILDGLNLASNDYILFERTDDDTVPNITADIIYTGSLRNSGEIILLKNNEDIIDTADFSTGWPETSDITTTLERDCNDLSIWQISNIENGSPKELNTICEQPDDIVIDPEPKPEPINLTITGSSCQYEASWNCIDNDITLDIANNLASLPFRNGLNFISSTQNDFDIIKINKDNDNDANERFDITIFIFYATEKVIAIAKNWLFFGNL